MKNNNSFSLSFGKEPLYMINRNIQEQEIIADFTSENPTSQVYMITGVRGLGKTVTMTLISNEIGKLKDWVTVSLFPERNLIEQLTAELYSQQGLLKTFKEYQLNIKLPGIELSFGNGVPVTDSVVAIDRMVNAITKHNKRLLVTIDEAVSNTYMREFVSYFQVLLRKNYSIFLLMTGLYENIHALQNEKTLTFLYRAPRVVLKPLNKLLMAKKYIEALNIDDNTANDMSEFTKGYPFAFQVLGYLCTKEKCVWTKTIDEFDAYMEDYVYDKLWSEMSENDKAIACVMASEKVTRVEDIRKILNMTSSTFNTYRKRLIGKGIITATHYAHVDFALPRFDNFILRNM